MQPAQAVLDSTEPPDVRAPQPCLQGTRTTMDYEVLLFTNPEHRKRLIAQRA